MTSTVLMILANESAEDYRQYYSECNPKSVLNPGTIIDPTIEDPPIKPEREPTYVPGYVRSPGMEQLMYRYDYIRSKCTCDYGQ